MKWYLLVLMLFLTVASTVHAEDNEDSEKILESLYVAPALGLHIFDGRRDVDHTPILTAAVGYQFNQFWALELGYGYGTGKREAGGDTDISSSRVDLLYHLNDDSFFKPYVVGTYMQVKGLPTGGENQQFGLGMGIKKYFDPQFALRADLRGVNSVDERILDGFLTIGASYTFEFETPPPPDTDRDGVIDRWDECPGTPLGIPVDEVGCPLDSDQDKVIDFIDECPDTPQGDTVDEIGCTIFFDTDKDGVYDRYDECPNTPLGVAVDEVGCPLDEDKDGVYDTYDECPGTPLGARVDEVGCRIILQQTVTVTLNVTFEFDSAELSEDDYDDIAEVHAFMTLYPDTLVTLEGHTDSRGSDDYNKRLSQARADSVARALVERFNVEEVRVESIGYGEELPIATNETDEGRQRNRRVVAKIEALVETYAKKEADKQAE